MVIVYFDGLRYELSTAQLGLRTDMPDQVILEKLAARFSVPRWQFCSFQVERGANGDLRIMPSAA